MATSAACTELQTIKDLDKDVIELIFKKCASSLRQKNKGKFSSTCNINEQIFKFDNIGINSNSTVNNVNNFFKTKLDTITKNIITDIKKSINSSRLGDPDEFNLEKLEYITINIMLITYMDNINFSIIHHTIDINCNNNLETIFNQINDIQIPNFTFTSGRQIKTDIFVTVTSFDCEGDKCYDKRYHTKYIGHSFYNPLAPNQLDGLMRQLISLTRTIANNDFSDFKFIFEHYGKITSTDKQSIQNKQRLCLIIIDQLMNYIKNMGKTDFDILKLNKSQELQKLQIKLKDIFTKSDDINTLQLDMPLPPANPLSQREASREASPSPPKVQYNKKSYKLHTDKTLKKEKKPKTQYTYITVNKARVFLDTIKGKYKYVKV